MGMSVNNGPNNIAPINVTFGTGVAGATFITPDSLLAYCSTRLRNLDDAMQTQFKSQQQGIADSQVVQDIEQQIKDQFQNSEKDDKGALKYGANPQDQFFANLKDEAAKIQDPTAKAAALKAIDGYAQTKAGAKFDDIKSSTLDGLDSAKQGLSQGAELGMIGLQSLMSQRQTAVQMTTNLVQAFGESLKSVAGNVGK